MSDLARIKSNVVALLRRKDGGRAPDDPRLPSCEQIAAQLEVDSSLVRLALAELLGAGTVKKTGNTRGTRYQLSKAS